MSCSHSYRCYFRTGQVSCSGGQLYVLSQDRAGELLTGTVTGEMFTWTVTGVISGQGR